MKKSLSFMIILTLSLFCWSTMAVSAYAEGGLEYSGEDEDGSNIYELNDNAYIVTNVTEGETVEVAFFDVYKSASIQVMYNGKSYDYQPGDILFMNGSYVVFVYDDITGEYATFNFSIENELVLSNGNEAGDGAVTADTATDDGYAGGFDSSFDLLDEFEDGNAANSVDSYLDSAIVERELEYTYSEAYESLLFYVGDRNVLLSDIPNQAVVSGPVCIKPASNVAQYVYYNGEIIATPEEFIYTNPGYYDIVTFLYGMENEDVDSDNVKASVVETHFRFTLLSDNVSYISVVNPPPGYSFNKIEYMGNETAIPADDYFFLENDGEYYVEFVSDKDERLIYSVSFVRDTVAPIIYFDSDVFEREVKAPISYTIDEEEAEIRIFKDGMECKVSEENIINQSGAYRIIVTDRAGNSRTYEFFLHGQNGAISIQLLYMFAAIVVAGLLYFWAVRKSRVTLL